MENSSKNKQQSQEKAEDHSMDQIDGGHTLALRVIKALEEGGFEARLAGGCVRDRLLGIRPHDYDVATNALPDQICLIFKQKSIKAVPTGIDHGTITVVIAGQGIEVTSLRRDVSTDGRRATVAFGSSFEEDAERRDFTFNAMFEDREGRLYDFFGGQDDLKKGRLRFVGEAKERMREDYLRILRLFRFWARFGFEPDQETLEACRQEAPGLKIVSQERITHELLVTLEGDFAGSALRAMDQTGVLARILEISAIDSLIPTLDALKIGRKAERSAARLALLFKDLWDKDQNLLRKRLQELRLAKNFQQKLQLHLEVAWYELDLSPAVALESIDQWEILGGDFLESILPFWKVLFPAESQKLLELEKLESRYGHRRKAKPPLDGQMLMTRFKLHPGPELGQALMELKRRWRLEQWNTAEEGFLQAERILADLKTI